ncbi:MAG: hypothetical protein ABI231_12605 [Candidatus Tumulicola sp.]
MKLQFIVPILLFSLVGCATVQRGTIFQPVPSGTILLRLVGGNGDVISSGPKHPFAVHNGFSLYVNEAKYVGYFTATTVSWTAPQPCYSVPAKPNNAVLTFSPVPSCHPGYGGVDGIRVSDTLGNSTTQYFENK